MKRIGILTFVETCNYGAFWQAYCLLNVVKKYTDGAVNVCNYVNPFQKRNLLIALFWRQSPVILYYNFLKYYRFNMANKLLDLTPKLKNVDALSKFDLIISGSDVIWNFKNRYFGKDPVFFGVGFNAEKIAYAPSFGTISPDEQLPKRIVNGIRSFKKVSVRDENSQLIIKKWCRMDVPVVLDPTLLFDLSEDIVFGGQCCEIKFVAVYGKYFTDETIAEIKKLAQKRGLKTIALGYRQNWCDSNYMHCGPMEWADYIRKSEFVMTSTFHGTIFSLIFKKPFATELHPSIVSKTVPLLQKIGLLGRIMKQNESLEILLDTPVNYIKVNEKIKALRYESIDYLKGAL